MKKSIDGDLLRVPSSTGLFFTNFEKTDITFPLFEVKAAYASPVKYFQPASVENTALPCTWSHRATRAIGFSGDSLVFFSKFPSRSDKNQLHSFILVNIPRKEIKSGLEKGIISISYSGEIHARNMKNGATAIKISFTFANRKHLSMSKKDVGKSSLVGDVYGDNAEDRLASSDMSGYVISVPHFSPHPYIMNIHKKLGFASRYALLTKTHDYFIEHLGLNTEKE